jgi:adenine specific DNA methylase Mod
MVASRSISDYIDSEKPIKAFHDWEQSIIEAGYVIKYLTVENQIVLDPLMASGTTGMASLKLNRKFIGIGIDPPSLFKCRKKIIHYKKSAQAPS